MAEPLDQLRQLHTGGGGVVYNQDPSQGAAPGRIVSHPRASGDGGGYEPALTGVIMAGVPYISDSEFKSKVLDSAVPVLLDFTAAWCGPCKAIAPLLDQVQTEKGAAIAVYKLDIDDNPDTPLQFSVQSIPTLLLFKNGKLVNRNVGALNKGKLDQFVATAL